MIVVLQIGAGIALGAFAIALLPALFRALGFLLGVIALAGFAGAILAAAFVAFEAADTATGGALASLLGALGPALLVAGSLLLLAGGTIVVWRMLVALFDAFRAIPGNLRRGQSNVAMMRCQGF